MIVKVATHVGDDFGTGYKSLFHIWVYRQVHIALSVALLWISKAIVNGALLISFYDWKRLYCLGQNRKFGHMQGDLPSLGGEDVSCDTDKITDSQKLFENGVVKLWIRIRRDIISAHIDL